MEVLLDTSFILICLKEKIDFLKAEKYGEIIIPKEVIDELKKLIKRKKGKERERAELALDIINKNKKKFKIIKLEKKYVDSGIKKYVEKKKGVIVATLDAGLKRSLRGKAKLLVIRARKKLELI